MAVMLPTPKMHAPLLSMGTRRRNGGHNGSNCVRNRPRCGSNRRWDRNGSDSSRRRGKISNNDNSNHCNSTMLGRYLSQRQSVDRYVLLVLPGKDTRKKNGLSRWQKGVGLNSQGLRRKWLYRQYVWGNQSVMVRRHVTKKGN